MKFFVERDALLRAMDHARRIVESRHTIPILGNVALLVGSAGLVIRATDLDLQVETTCPADVVTAGAATVAVGTLFDLLKRLPSGCSVTLEQEAAGRVVVRSGRSRVGLPTLPFSDFPELRLAGDAHEFALPGKELSRMLGAVNFAISTEETRIYLNGIYLQAMHPEDGAAVLRAVASDGHRLAMIDMPAPEGCAGMPSLILPRKAQHEFAKLADAVGDGPVSLSVHASGVRASALGTVLTTKIIDATFPDYQRLIPVGNDRHLTVTSDHLRGALDRALIVIAERGNAVKLSIEAEQVTVTVDGSGGEVREEIDAELDGSPIDVGFNAKYGRAIIDALESDTLRIDLGDPGSPMIWRRGGNDGPLCLLMPMRV
ncbi:DNA polymerase III subunit beta [Methylobacterium sp. ARG-1]|uniref:DNA polymerase III subunit beta n=1 Tax=Methylobacterium sp. ARG-1 TaxID=1692501 RepID=UPI0006829D7F|nr:DNA polymerase III subunit beta [Methylobacterium sp. ARG-1]KNY20377.1 hypothetical protein AKJ13_22370 [Methylobacterium sp. ARG-1]